MVRQTWLSATRTAPIRTVRDSIGIVRVMFGRDDRISGAAWTFAVLAVAAGILAMHGLGTAESMPAVRSQMGHELSAAAPAVATAVFDRGMPGNTHAHDLASCIWVLVSTLGIAGLLVATRVLGCSRCATRGSARILLVSTRAPPSAQRLSLVGVLRR